MKLKNYIVIVGIIVILLSIPLVAMQFTTEVSWNVVDFVIAAVLFLGVGFLIDLLIRKISSKSLRILLILLAIVLSILLWIELAVGIFDTTLAGD